MGMVMFCAFVGFSVSTASGNGVLSGFTALQYGHRLDRKLINSFAPFSILDCAGECLRTSRCVSINYHRGTRYCEINYQTQNEIPAMFLKDPTWIYGDRADWDTRISGPCADISCAVNEKCEADNDGVGKCVLSDCGVPVNSQLTTDDIERSDAIGVGRKMHMRCSDQYREQIGTGEHRCLPNGQWQSSKITCNIQCPDIWACSAWIGASDRDQEGVYLWDRGGRPVDAQFWYIGQPDDGGLGTQDCVHFLRTGNFDDYNCEIALNFFCEK